MEIRQKLSLPAGMRRAASKKSVAAALTGLVFAALLTGYFALLPEKKTTSASAFLGGSFLEIHAQNSGQIEYIAKAGQPVAAGEVVLCLNTAEYEQAAKNAQEVVSGQSGTLTPQLSELMLQYLAVPQSEAELAENVQKTAEFEKSCQVALAALTERQAMFSLELRRLELKRGRIAEEEARMEAMRVEEELLRGSLRKAGKDFETASLERSAALKRLQRKRDLERTMLSLPPAQREQLYALEAEFYKIYEAERQMELANVASPQNGRVIYAALAAGSVARESDVALYILPDENPDVWVTAYFSQSAADKMQLGGNCTVTVGGSPQTALAGIVAERMPEIDPGQSGETPFKIRFSNLEAAQFVGVNPGQPVSVSLEN